jgi:hypothetical protein
MVVKDARALRSVGNNKQDVSVKKRDGVCVCDRNLSPLGPLKGLESVTVTMICPASTSHKSSRYVFLPFSFIFQLQSNSTIIANRQHAKSYHFPTESNRYEALSRQRHFSRSRQTQKSAQTFCQTQKRRGESSTMDRCREVDVIPTGCEERS